MTKFYRIDVTMKHGFKYSMVSNARMLAGLKNSSEGFWTKSVDVSEITSEEYSKFYGTDTEKKKQVVTEVATEEPPKKNSRGKKSGVKFSSLEEFFDSSEPAPKNKKLKKRV